MKQEARNNEAAGETVSESNQVAVPSDTPEPSVPKPVDGFADWMRDRPFAHAMRMMWIDTGTIIGNSYYPEYADRDILRYSADSLAQKAGRFADHFGALRDHNRDSFMAAKNGNWEGAATGNELAHQDCGNCHYEFWPLSARGFVKETMEGWSQNGTVFSDEPWGEQVFTSPASVRLSMVNMRTAMGQANMAIMNEDLDAFRSATERLHKFADKQFKIWDGIKRQAEAIANLARDNKLDEVGGHYIKLTKYCRDCHADSSDGRGLDPLLWEQQ